MNEIIQLIVFASIEEVIKLGIVLSLRKTGIKKLSYFLFFLIEALSKIGSFKFGYSMQHYSELGATSLSILVSVGTSIFHFYTSILYGNSQRIYFALAICIIVHTVFNFIVVFAIYFDPTWHAPFVWTLSSIGGLVIFVYFKLERRLTSSSI
jgi:hypothetical protein